MLTVEKYDMVCLNETDSELCQENKNRCFYLSKI